MRTQQLLLLLIYSITSYSQCLNQQWTRNMGAHWGSANTSTSVATDKQGNSYVVGKFNELLAFDKTQPLSLTRATFRDLFIAKYNSTGVFQWVRCVGGANGDVEAKRIVIDTAGFLMIGGVFSGNVDFDPSSATYNLSGTGGNEIFLARYDASGQFVWASKMSTSGGSELSDMKVDKNNELVVCGRFSQNTNFSLTSCCSQPTTNGTMDAFLAKYTMGGTLVWVWNIGGAGTSDNVTGIDIGSDNSIYVCGNYSGNVDFDPSVSTYSLPSSSSIFIAHYGPSGNFKWAKGLGGNQQFNSSNAIYVDPKKRITIAGYLPASGDMDPSSSVTTLTLGGYLAQYDSLGTMNYAVNIGGVGLQICGDNSSKIYLGGVYISSGDFDPSSSTATLATSGMQDVFVANYDSTGAYQWVKGIHGGGPDLLYGMSLTNNAIHFCGYFWGQVDFDPSSSQSLGGSLIYESFYLCSFDKSGNFNWQVHGVDADGQNDVGASIITDASNDVYVTGSYMGTVDFDPSPSTATLTTKRSYTNTNTATNIFLAKYDAGGNYLWAHGFGNWGVRNIGTALNSNSSGDVFLYGYFEDTLDIDPSSSANYLVSKGGTDVFIARFTSNGALIWGKSFGGKYDEQGNLALGLDVNGDLVISGMFSDTVDFDPGTATFSMSTKAFLWSGFIAKFNSTGGFVWAKKIDSKAFASPYGLALSNSDVIITGVYRDSTDFDPGTSAYYLNTIGFGDNTFIARYSSSGNLLWAKRLRSTSANRGSAVFADNSGNLYLGGEFFDSLDVDPSPVQNYRYGHIGSIDNYIAKYDATGNLIWAKTFGDGGHDRLYDLKVKNADIFATGSFRGVVDFDAGTGTDFKTASGYNSAYLTQYNSLGNYVCTVTKLSDGDDAGHNIAFSKNSSDVFLTGDYKTNLSPYTGFFPGHKDLLVEKYSYTCTTPQMPTAVNSPTLYCDNAPVFLTVNSDGNIAWYSTSSASTAIATGPTLSFTALAPGSYTYYSLATGCNFTTAIVPISFTVYGAPNVSVSASPSIVCSGSTVNLVAGGAQTYTWSNGASGSQQMISPASTSVINVIGYNTIGCSASKNVTVNVLSLPTLSISPGSQTVCSGTGVSYTVTGADTYSWSTGPQGPTITFTPQSSSILTVTGTNTLTVCKNTKTVSVTVLALPVVSVQGQNSICVGDSVLLTAIGAMNYQWNTGQNTGSINLTVVSSTIVSVTGTDLSGCSATTGFSVLALPLPTLMISGTAMACVGDTATYNVLGAVSYTWQNGIKSGTIYMKHFADSLLYVVGQDANGCVSTVSLQVYVNPLPLVVISGPTITCPGTSQTLTATGANQFAWVNGPNTGSIQVTPQIGTNYTVTGVDQNGCKDTATHFVATLSQATIQITGQSSVCAGMPTALVVSGGSSYWWQHGSTNDTIIVMPTVNSTYTVQSTYTNGCVSEKTHSIAVIPLPDIGVLLSSSIVCVGEQFTLTPYGAVNYTCWPTGVTQFPAVLPIYGSTVFTITGSDVNNCTTTTITTVNVSECLTSREIEARALPHLFPNPCMDKLTVYIPENNGYEGRMYNQLGQEIMYFWLNDELETLDLRILPTGMYHVILRSSTADVFYFKVVRQN